MIRRATLDDVADVNRWIGRDFPGVDFSEVLSNPMNVCLAEGESGAIFVWRGPGIYEGHLFYEVRGRAALSLAERMMKEMALGYGAGLLWALIPLPDRRVRLFLRRLGWKSLGHRETERGPQELFISENV